MVDERRKLRVAFVHPDLGLGGAERLVIDAAAGLDDLGHRCTIYTAHLDRRRAFAEVLDGRVRAQAVRVPLPRAVVGRLHALMAALRTALVALWVALFARPDVAIVDIVTLPAAVLAACGVPVLFYCHYPDALLHRDLRGAHSTLGALRRVYRRAVDALEALALRSASAVAVNSAYTARAFAAAFPGAAPPTVVHPCVAPDAAGNDEPPEGAGKRPFVLSLNRFERKKNVALAIDALAKMRNPCRLVLAGGYDTRVRENVEHYAELERRAEEAGLAGRVRMVRNVTAEERCRLLRRAMAVVYTPAGEHFGIVPLEAMAASTPVVAVDDAGPKESVRHSITGFLCAPEAGAFANALDQIVGDPEKAKRMGEEGRRWVEGAFSRKEMAHKLDALLQGIVS